MDVTLSLVSLNVPEGTNVILGQAHFIKTIEDIYEALAESVPGIKFGVAFCEASQKRLVRSEGNDEELVKLAEEEALKIGAGHTFIIYICEAFPINVLPRLRQVSEIVRIFAATANPLQVVIAESEQGRGILGVIDGSPPQGVETDEDAEERYDILRKFGYKL